MTLGLPNNERNQRMKLRLNLILLLGLLVLPAIILAQDRKPNILVIFGDDIGMWNVGAYTHGMMGRTPNIDRIANEGILLLTTMASQVAQPDVRLLSWDRCRFAPA